MVFSLKSISCIALVYNLNVVNYNLNTFISFVANAPKYKKFIKKIQSIKNNILHLVCHGLKSISYYSCTLNFKWT